MTDFQALHAFASAGERRIEWDDFRRLADRAGA